MQTRRKYQRIKEAGIMSSLEIRDLPEKMGNIDDPQTTISMEWVNVAAEAPMKRDSRLQLDIILYILLLIFIDINQNLWGKAPDVCVNHVWRHVLECCGNEANTEEGSGVNDAMRWISDDLEVEGWRKKLFIYIWYVSGIH